MLKFKFHREAYLSWCELNVDGNFISGILMFHHVSRKIPFMWFTHHKKLEMKVVDKVHFIPAAFWQVMSSVSTTFDVVKKITLQKNGSQIQKRRRWMVITKNIKLFWLKIIQTVWYCPQYDTQQTNTNKIETVGRKSMITKNESNPSAPGFSDHRHVQM